MSEQTPFYHQPQWYPTPPTPFEQASRQGAAYVGGVLLTMSALTVGDYLHDYEQQHVLPYLKEADQPRIEQRMEPPREVRYQLGVVAISASEQDSIHTSTELLDQQVGEAAQHIMRTLPNYTITANTTLAEHVDPDGQHTKHNQLTGQDELVPCYTQDAINKVLDRESKATKPRPDVAIAVMNSKEFEVCDSNGWGGIAYTKNGQPRNIIKPADNITHVVGHELGHVIGPDKRPDQRGLGHQVQFVCWRNEPTADHLGSHADTIQNLLMYGCKVSSQFGEEDAHLDEYGSPLTAMGFVSRKGVPLFSPPEVARLDPTRWVDRMNKPVYGRYELSYQPDKRFGIEIELPQDHVARTAFPDAVPDASHIFIGPYLFNHRGDDTDQPYEERDSATDIGVFLTGGLESSANTLVMDNNDEIGELSEDPDTPLMLYADEQLDMVVMSSVDQTTKQRYVDILPLSSDEGSQLYRQHIYPPIGKANLP